MNALRHVLEWLRGLFNTGSDRPAGANSHNWESRIKEEIEAFERAIHIEPDNAQAYYSLAATYDSIGRSQEAIVIYKEAIRIDPYFPPAHFLLGNRYVIEGNKESALQIHNQLCKLDADLADTLFDSISNWTFPPIHALGTCPQGNSNDS